MPLQNNSPEENLRFGSDYLTKLQQHYGGSAQLALAAFNAGTGRVDSALQQAGGDPQKALATLPAETQAYVPKVMGQLGVSAPKAANDKFSQNKAFADKALAAGMIKPSDYQQVVLTGKAPAGGEDMSQPLSPGREALAQKLSTYGLPISSRFIQTPANQDLVSRAIYLNPDLDVNDYAQHQTFLKGLANTTATSVGGGINAAATAIGHLRSLADDSDNLPQGSKLFNKLQIGASNLTSPFMGAATSKADTKWTQGVSFVSGEMAKMVKAGVASDSEVKALEDNFNAASSPIDRKAALSNAAEFLYAKVHAYEQQRSQILGAQDPGTSLLTKDAQDALNYVVKNGGDAPLKLLAPSTSYGNRSVTAAQPATNAALQDALSKYGN
jgi:hypothetical protein